MENLERTLVLIKPDGVQRGLVGEIISRFERVGLKLTAMKMVHASHEDVDQHYALTEEWMKAVYEKAKAKYAKQFPKLNLFTINDAFGGWDKAAKDHFADNASFDQIYTKK